MFPDHFIRIDKIIHRHEIEAGSEFVPEQQLRDFLKQIPRREQEEKGDGKPPVPPSAVPLPGQDQQIRSMGRIEKRQETIVVPTQTGKETRRPFSDKCRLEDSRRPVWKVP